MPWFNNLPDLVQTEITEWKLKHKITYNKLFEDTPLICLNPKSLIYILLRLNIVRRSNTFNKGNLIVAKRGVDRGILVVFNANDDDVKDYSNKELYYYVFRDKYKLQ
jgi:hypothetical protein